MELCSAGRDEGRALAFCTLIGNANNGYREERGLGGKERSEGCERGHGKGIKQQERKCER